MPRLFDHMAEARPDAIALADETGSQTWAETAVRVDRLIHAFRGIGCEVGDAVALQAQNSRAWLEVDAAAIHAGLVLVPINWHLTADEVAYILADSQVKALLADDHCAAIATDALTRAPGVRTAIGIESGWDGALDYEELIAAQPASTPQHQSAGTIRNYTSGTTGRPKGVVAKHVVPGSDLEQTAEVLDANRALLRFADGGTSVVNAPLYHAGPRLHDISFLRGGTVVTRRRFDAAETLRLIDEYSADYGYVVPTQMKRLLSLPDEVRADFSGASLSAVWHTGAPCPPPLKQAMIDWWGPVIHEIYGATDAGVGTVVYAEEWLEKPGTVGRPIEIVDILIIGEDGESLGPNEPGTIYIKHQPGVDLEYLNAPDKTAEAHLDHGVVTVGDVGYLDEDGYLFLTDRKIDMIISGGVNIYPAEIEACLITHPAVADVGVFGVPNDEFGEEVKGAVQPQPGVEPTDALADELRRYARERIAGYKVPRTIDFHDALPRTPTGKLLKRELRAPYWQGRERSI